GVRHEGTPEGKIETIGGVQCYVATPTTDYPKNKCILYVTDVFGIHLPNHQLMADDFARNGFKVIVPDIVNGDPVPADALAPGSDYDLKKWLANHGAPNTRPALDKVVAALNSNGVSTIAAVGFCFGARYVFDLAFDNLIAVAAVAHPSLLQVPLDLEKYAASSKAPLLINTCPVDVQFPIESQAKADEILAGFAPGYRRDFFQGCTHGFAVRGDLTDPKVKAGKEGAFKATVEWFMKHL
ncbi:Alpha/Beta hydrolase protein, partial [Mycena polygramma]